LLEKVIDDDPSEYPPKGLGEVHVEGKIVSNIRDDVPQEPVVQIFLTTVVDQEENGFLIVAHDLTHRRYTGRRD
jgi:hypothetical protein